MSAIPAESEAYLVSAPNYQTKVYKSTPHWIQFERFHHWPADHSEIDVFGDCWTFTWTNFANNQVGFHRRGRLQTLDGACALLIPPFSVIDWRFRGGTIFWQAILTDLPYPPHFPAQAQMYPRRDNEYIPSSLSELIEFIESHSPHCTLNKEEQGSAVAYRAKRAIDDHWLEELSIEDLCQTLGFNHTSVDRAFKKCFDLTPIQYRNRMRILNAAHKLLLGEKNVTQAAYESGFSGLDHFIRQFKKLMKVSPSWYANS